MTRLMTVTIILTVAVALGCDRGYGPPDPPGLGLGSPKVDLDSERVKGLAALEGPYIFIEAKTPGKIVLTDIQAQAEEFELVGIQSRPYDTPAQRDANGKVIEPTPEEKEALAKNIQEMQAFTTNALKEFCGDQRLYITRMSDWKPSLIYLYLPDVRAALGQATPQGSATLVNAWMLRQGAAIMHLEGGTHPFYQTMLDCQVWAIAEAGRLSNGSAHWGDFWGKYGLWYPEEPVGRRLKETEAYR